MSHERKITVAESGAFIHLTKPEPTGSGLLDGLSFGVKDLIDIQGYVTGCGNPDWAQQHPPAPANAVCVDQMLASGASCIGKTVSDELAFSLDGENVFYGTPLNPRAPSRVPGALQAVRRRPWPADLWISPLALIRAARFGFRRVTAEFLDCDLLTDWYLWLESSLLPLLSTQWESWQRTSISWQEWLCPCSPAKSRLQHL